MRLIDADMADVVIIYDKGNELTQVSAIREYIERQRAFLDKFPTIDALPVIRCKDCKHHEDEEIGMVYCPNALGGWVAENWFCADGERKEGQA